MRDFIDFIRDTWVVWLIISVVGALVAWGVASDIADYNRRMKQCLDDGKKEYECYSMLKQDVVPVYIPIPTGGR